MRAYPSVVPEDFTPGLFFLAGLILVIKLFLYFQPWDSTSINMYGVLIFIPAAILTEWPFVTERSTNFNYLYVNFSAHGG